MGVSYNEKTMAELADCASEVTAEKLLRLCDWANREYEYAQMCYYADNEQAGRYHDGKFHVLKEALEVLGWEI